MGIFGSVAKFGFSRKIEFLGAINSMNYRIPHSSKTNFATEPDLFNDLYTKFWIRPQMSTNDPTRLGLNRRHSAKADFRVDPEQQSHCRACPQASHEGKPLCFFVVPQFLLFALAALTTALSLAFANTALGADDYSYKSRVDRNEGVKDRPISGYNVEVLSAIADFFEDSIDPQGVLRIKFYLLEDHAAYLVVREIDRKHNYWLDNVQPARWPKGFGNEFKWPMSDVIQPLGIRKSNLGVVARIGEPLPTNPETIAPVVFYQNQLPKSISAYIFTLKTGARSRVTCSIYKEGEDQPTTATNVKQQNGGQPFTFRWDASRAPEGKYKLVITGFILSTNAPLHHVVRFYHQPKVFGE